GAAPAGPGRPGRGRTPGSLGAAAGRRPPLASRRDRLLRAESLDAGRGRVGCGGEVLGQGPPGPGHRAAAVVAFAVELLVGQAGGPSGSRWSRCKPSRAWRRAVRSGPAGSARRAAV